MIKREDAVKHPLYKIKPKTKFLDIFKLIFLLLKQNFILFNILNSIIIILKSQVFFNKNLLMLRMRMKFIINLEHS